ncbi:hypothetical protein JI747_014865 [Chryseobacterium sp. RG1]|uniref:YcxB-like protein n=1 Tax=Chryseobacterium tagetis TaxID=2801334 RepID=A0ABS8A753_9FLAO|nr:hypothetical protein [Chryseobacterium tagetis]MCA6068465.1 hypothetical protein [Chryseobacterium tagetis]
MDENKITISVFNTKYSFWATIITILFLLPSVILFIKFLDVRYTTNQTKLIIVCLSLIFGFLIVVMKTTMRKIDIIKTDHNCFIKYNNGETFLLSDDINYNIYNYNSRKAFMLRILDGKTTKFLLSLDMNLKPEVEVFFNDFIKKKNKKDFIALAFPILMCFAYFIISVVFVLFIPKY